MCFSVWECILLCGIVFQFVRMCFSLWECATVCVNVFQVVGMCFSVGECVTVYGNVFQCVGGRWGVTMSCGIFKCVGNVLKMHRNASGLVRNCHGVSGNLGVGGEVLPYRISGVSRLARKS